MNTGEIIKVRNEKLGPHLVKVFQARRFQAWYCRTAAEALETGLGLIAVSDLVSWGGSMTVEALGIKEALAARGNPLIDRDTARSPDEQQELMRKALLCDTFLMSANALSESGCLVNIDGVGNRIAALSYGPRQVLVFAGLNKVTQTLEDAVQRARTVAAPRNINRFPGLETPCAKTGMCINQASGPGDYRGGCTGADSACSHIVITRMCKPAGRIKLILIGEDLGL